MSQDQSPMICAILIQLQDITHDFLFHAPVIVFPTPTTLEMGNSIIIEDTFNPVNKSTPGALVAKKSVKSGIPGTHNTLRTKIKSMKNGSSVRPENTRKLREVSSKIVALDNPVKEGTVLEASNNSFIDPVFMGFAGP